MSSHVKNYFPLTPPPPEKKQPFLVQPPRKFETVFRFHFKPLYLGLESTVTTAFIKIQLQNIICSLNKKKKKNTVPYLLQKCAAGSFILSFKLQIFRLSKFENGGEIKLEILI